MNSITLFDVHILSSILIAHPVRSSRTSLFSLIVRWHIMSNEKKYHLENKLSMHATNGAVLLRCLKWECTLIPVCLVNLRKYTNEKIRVQTLQ